MAMLILGNVRTLNGLFGLWGQKNYPPPVLFHMSFGARGKGRSKRGSRWLEPALATASVKMIFFSQKRTRDTNFVSRVRTGATGIDRSLAA
jgi:hypothetical protein